MPPEPAPESPPEPRGLWLALSGGGLRAGIYHYGCLKRLHDVGLLSRVAVVSATSGGAVAAALLVASGAAGRSASDAGWATFERRLLKAARDGLLGPMLISGLALLLYAAGAVLGILGLFARSLSTASLVVFAAAFVVHGWTVVRLRRLQTEPDLARRLVRMDARFKDTALSVAAIGFWNRLHDDLVTALNPDKVRSFVLHHQLYDHMPLGWLILGPKLFLVAADLGSGREMVFSATTLAELGPAGCAALWRQDNHSTGAVSTVSWDDPDESTAFRVTYDAYDIPVSTAVAASSAYPPVFAPVQVTIAGQHAGSFIDGGVIDNRAINVACRMARHVGAVTAHNFSTGTVPDQVSHLLAIDAGATPSLDARPITSRLGALVRRLPSILSSRQMQKSLDDAEDIGRLTKVSTTLIALKTELPPGTAVATRNVVKRAAKIRTHFDAFTAIEIASLAYLGARQTDMWVKDHFPDLHVMAPPVPSSPADVLPPDIPLPALDEHTIVAHLTWSSHRFGPFRAYKRWRTGC